ncbi:DUF1540 domain-containing protein [Paenibacillus albiflavus]|uniref:DUF1540 domain-containing protein n=1 Tax=Paenibacillus albiflavus TaxID=2545760 RepID=UPI0038B284F9
MTTKPVVKCSVSNCTYWGQNNLCHADSIIIDIDQHANRNYNSEFAAEFEHQDTARSASSTCCHTFQPKK